MSIKIYEAFRLDMPADQALMVLGQQRSPIMDLVDAKHARVLAQRTADYLDRWALCRSQPGVPEAFQKNLDVSALHRCGFDLLEAQEQCRRGHTRNPDVDCDVLLRLFMDYERRQVLGFSVDEGVGVQAHLRTLPGVVDYAYWNNTDRPNTVSARDWKERGRTWARVTEGDGKDACEFAMTWRALPILATEAVAAHLPTFRARVRQRSTSQVLNEYMAQAWAPRSPGDFSGMSAALFKGRELLEDPASELSTQRAAFEENLRETLIPDLSPYIDVPLEQVP